ncbi:bifunctional metallophosphatase/5'-nucleotidase [Streptococcaceae bacterium ESL0687]|nr:bifunctional metallophosphatase/5'-nucleotidase [Streptococcaceae bacterium ESL0687]
MRLTILETSDMHGYIMPTNFTEKDMNVPFGTAKVAQKMKELKEQAGGPVLQVENGDYIQGSPLSYYISKQPEGVARLAEITNAMGYDYGILGNHEFNYGPDYLKAAIESYNYPILAANILDDEGNLYYGKAYDIIEKDGLKIGVLGLTTQYIPHWERPSHITGMHFASCLETAKKYVPIIREEADIVVVSYHGGFERDLVTGEPTENLTGENEGYQILQEVAGIDAFLSGHQHREIAAEINGVPVVQPGYRGANIGRIVLDIELGENGYEVIASEATLESVADALPDAEIVALIDDLNIKVEEWLDQPMGEVKGDMTIINPMAARLKEHPYIEFINRVQMDATGAKISGTSLFNNDGKGFEPVITMRDIITNYIYPNTLAVLGVTGRDLRLALERTANFLVLDEDGQIVFNPRYINPKPQYYNYDMYEGVDYTIDMTKAEGEKIVSLSLDGRDIQDDDELRVAVNQYRAVGGGDYSMFSADKIIKEVQIDMMELIADYLRANPVIEATVNDNFKIIK